MLIELTHTTELTYKRPVRQSQMELRVCPAQLGDQVRLSFELAIGPAAQVNGYFDWLDNHVHAFGIDRPHDRIKIAATSLVQTRRPEVPVETLAELPDTWPVANAADVQADYANFDFLELGGPVGDSGALRDLAAAVNPREGEPLGAVVQRAMGLIGERFEYVKGVTTSATPVAEFIGQRRGVCQDFTHALIGMLRSLGVPTRYVSGIVHDERPDGTGDYLGASQTHAWAEVLFPSQTTGSDGSGGVGGGAGAGGGGAGEGDGWVGVDPTNACRAGPAFVKVAVGRHFADVPPNRGVFTGGGGEQIDVSVVTRKLNSVPPELTAERFRPLGIPAVSGQSQSQSQSNGLGQQQQQQQQSSR